MNDRDRFLVTYYNPDTLTRESNGVFGLIDNRFHTTPFIPVTLDSGLVNPKFLDFAFNVQSFYCECDRGFASFRCENRATKKGDKQYWYAYKKVNGKTKRFNIGDLSKINFEIIEEAIAVVCGLEVAQKKSATKKAIAPVVVVDAIANFPTSLAGNGKTDKHLQPSVIDCFESLAIAQNEIIILNKMLKEAQDDVRIANEKEHSLWVENGQLKGKLKKYPTQIDWLNAEIDALKTTLQKTQDNLKVAQDNLKVALVNVDRYELATRNEEKRNKNLRERIFELEHAGRDSKPLKNRIHQLECEIEKLQEYNRIGEQEAFDNLNTFEEVMPIIAKYRAMTTDKTKKANPRYAYLIDFLSEIDKLS